MTSFINFLLIKPKTVQRELTLEADEATIERFEVELNKLFRKYGVVSTDRFRSTTEHLMEFYD